MSRSSVGDFEKLVMLAALHLAGDAYGTTILRELEERTGRNVSTGAVYVALGRLERKGLVASRVGEPSPHRGGRPKRFFSVTPEGLEALRRAQKEWSAMVRGLEDTLWQNG